MKQRKMTMALAAVLVAGSLPVSVSAASFSDLSDTAWAAETITQVSDKGLISGYEDGTFRGKNNVTYCEAMVMLYNVMTKTNQTADVADNFYITYQSILNTYKIPMWAQYSTAYGLASGSVTPQMLTKFMYEGKSAPATREDVVSMFGRALSEKYDIYVGDGVEFNDAFKISEDALPYIDLMVRLGIITGDTNNNFNPKNAITRAEMAVIMNKTYDLLSNELGDSGEITAIVNHDGAYYDVDVQMDNGEKKKLTLSDDNISVLNKDGSRELPLSSLSKGDKVSIVMNGNVVSKIYLLNEEANAQTKYDVTGYLYSFKDNTLRLESENTGELSSYEIASGCVFYLDGKKSSDSEVKTAMEESNKKYTYVGLLTQAETTKDENIVKATAVYVTFTDEYTHTGEVSSVKDDKIYYTMSGSSSQKTVAYANDCEFYIGEDEAKLKDLQALADSGSTYIKITLDADGKAIKIIMSEDRFTDNQTTSSTYTVKALNKNYITVYLGGKSQTYDFASTDNVTFYKWNGKWESCSFNTAESFYDNSSSTVYARLNFNSGNQISAVYLASEADRSSAFGDLESNERKGTVASAKDNTLKFKTSTKTYQLKSSYKEGDIVIGGAPTSSLTVFTRMANCDDVTLYAEIKADESNTVTDIEAYLTAAKGTLVEYDKDEKIIKIRTSDGSEFRLETSSRPKTPSDEYTYDDIATSGYVGSTVSLGFDSSGIVNYIEVTEKSSGTGNTRIKGIGSMDGSMLQIDGSGSYRMDSQTTVSSKSFGYSSIYTIQDMLKDDALKLYVSATVNESNNRVEYIEVTMQDARGTFQKYESNGVTLYTSNGGKYVFDTVSRNDILKACGLSEVEDFEDWQGDSVRLSFNSDGIVDDIVR